MVERELRENVMDKYTKAVLTVIALSVLALPLKAEEKVWYCEMTGSAMTTLEGDDLYKKEKFKMKVSLEEVVFGSGGFFHTLEIPINRWFDQNNWIASNEASFLYFQEGTLHYAQASWITSVAISARCDDF